MKTKVFLLVTLLTVFFPVSIAFAQDAAEEIVLTTYYPAPYGNYDELYADKWLQLNRTGDDTGELRLAAPDTSGTLTTFWNLHNRGPGSGAGAIPGGDDNKLYLTYYDGAAWSGPHMVVTPAGEVGIGTPEPNTALDLDGAFSIRGIPTVSAPPVAPVDEGRIYFDSDTDTFRVSENGGAYEDLAVGAGGAFWALTATGNHIYNTNTGNVGIRTTTPSYELDVSGGIRARDGIHIGNTGVWGGLGALFFGPTGNEAIGSGVSCIYRHSIYGTVIAAGPVRTMVLKDTGNVGIGTLNPGTELEVSRGQAANTTVRISNPSTFPSRGTALEFAPSAAAGPLGRIYQQLSGGTYNFVFENLYNLNNASIVFRTNFLERMRIALNGNVYVNGVLVHSSDIRSKKDIKTIPDALEKVLALRGVNFYWKEGEGKDSSLQMGLIAQEVEKVIPEVVYTSDDKQGMKSLAYSQLVAVLVEAIKAQNERITALEAKE